MEHSRRTVVADDVLVAISGYLEGAHEAAQGEGSSILDYAHIMELVEGLGAGEGQAVLWSILPRFLQGAVDLEQVGQRAARSAQMMRNGYPPVGVPPCTPGFDLEQKGRDVFVRFEDEDILASSMPSEHGEAIRKNASGEFLLVLEFYPEDTGDWFGEWLDLKDQPALRRLGLSLGVESFDLDSSTVKVKSHGWRDKDGELLIRSDDGYTLFTEVFPVQVRQGSDVGSTGFGAPVVVVLLLEGGWKSFPVDEADNDAE